MKILRRLRNIILTGWIALPLTAIGEVDPEAIVDAHNRWRAAVGVHEKISYSETLAASAQAWVDHLKQSEHCQMHHSHGEYGENLFWASALRWSDGRQEMQRVSSQKVVDSWGSEKSYYDYATNSCTPGKMCGHYTQIVWRNTREVGCAIAVCGQEQVWACQYAPAGNWVGNRPY